MQKTRQKILEYLREHGEATVNDLSAALNDLTPVTVRHHLDVLHREGFITIPELRHRSTPGRPRHIYRLTERADAYFPNNVHSMARHLLSELEERYDEREVNVIFGGVANRMAGDFFENEAELASLPPVERLKRAVAHLNTNGYLAHLEETPEGFILHTGRCPFRGVVEQHNNICLLDLNYISRMIGCTPQKLTNMQEGDQTCSYLVSLPHKTKA